MTSETQTPANEGIPRFFADFILENARQHAELAARMGDLRVETERQFGQVRAELGQLRAETAQRESRLIKWVIGAMVAFTMAWSGAVYGIVRALTDSLN